MGLSTKVAAEQFEDMASAENGAAPQGGTGGAVVENRDSASVDPSASNEAEKSNKDKQVQTQCNSVL